MLPVLLEVLPTPMRDHLLATAEANPAPDSAPDSGQPARTRKKRIGTLQELLEVHPEFQEVWMDATEQEVPKPKAKVKRKQCYSGKAKCHTLKTQVTATLATGHRLVLHVLGQVPGSVHDHLLLRASGVLRALPEDAVVHVDRGYEGVEQEYPEVHVEKAVRAKRNQKLTVLGRAYNRMQNRRRIGIEHLLGHLQRFKVLSGVYRGQPQQHEDIFVVVAGLHNYRQLGQLAWA
jgi:hypothetical protein